MIKPESSFDTRRTSPSEETLESTVQKLCGTLELLKDWGVSPDVYTVETQRTPFGRFGDGYLATSLTDDNGFRSVALNFQSAQDDPRASFSLKRSVGDKCWHDKNGQGFSDQSVIRYLDANWPQQLIDNSSVRHVMSQEKPSLDEIFELVSENLQPTAPLGVVKNIYIYRDITIGESGNCSSASLSIGTLTDKDGFTSVAARIIKPQLAQDGPPTNSSYQISIDEMGTPSIKAWHDHADKRKPYQIPLSEITEVCAEFELMLEQMADEKIFGQTKEI